MLSAYKVRLQTLLGLLREGSIDDIEFYRRVARIVAEAVKCSRAGVWLFRDESDGRAITCMGMYDRVRGRSTVVSDVNSAQAIPFYKTLATSGYVVANDALNHPTTRLFFEQKLTQLNVRSLVAAAFSVNGRLYGAFSCTQIDEPRRWTQMEVLLLKRLGANASLVLSEADTCLQRNRSAEVGIDGTVGGQGASTADINVISSAASRANS